MNPTRFKVTLLVTEAQQRDWHEVLQVKVDATWDSQDQAVTEFTVESEQGVRHTVPVWAIMSSLADAIDQEMRKMKIITIQQVMAGTPEPAPFTYSDAFAIQQILEVVQGNRYVAFSTNGGVDVQEGTARRIGDERGNSLPDTDIRDQFVWITTNIGMELFLPVRQVMGMVRDLLFQPFDPRTTETGGRS